MGIYSKEAEQAYAESGLILNKAPEDYYKAKMFYGNIQAYIDASNETEAKYFAARAINDFDTFCKCYTPDNGDKLNGIVVRPVGETANEFVACCTDINGNKKLEFIKIQEGQIKDVTTKVIDRTKEVANKTKEKIAAAKDKLSSKEEKKESGEVVEEGKIIEYIKDKLKSKKDKNKQENKSSKTNLTENDVKPIETELMQILKKTCNQLNNNSTVKEKNKKDIEKLVADWDDYKEYTKSVPKYKAKLFESGFYKNHIEVIIEFAEYDQEIDIILVSNFDESMMKSLPEYSKFKENYSFSYDFGDGDEGCICFYINNKKGKNLARDF